MQYKFPIGHKPHNKVEISPEMEQFIRDNYRTMNNIELGKKIGVVPKSMYRILKNMGITRTKEEIAVMVQTRNKFTEKAKTGIVKRRKIEGGGRNNRRAEWHLKCWIDKNGEVPTDCILMYKTKNYNDKNDVVLVKRNKYDAFVKKRDENLEIENKRKEREIRAQQNAEKTTKRLNEYKRKEEQEAFLNSIRNRSTDDVYAQERALGKVPVRLDDKTEIWVKKEKCNKLPNGQYVLKPGVTTKFSKIEQ